MRGTVCHGALGVAFAPNALLPTVGISAAFADASWVAFARGAASPAALLIVAACGTAAIDKPFVL